MLFAFDVFSVVQDWIGSLFVVIFIWACMIGKAAKSPTGRAVGKSVLSSFFK